MTMIMHNLWAMVISIFGQGGVPTVHGFVAVGARLMYNFMPERFIIHSFIPGWVIIMHGLVPGRVVVMRSLVLGWLIIIMWCRDSMPW